MTFENPTLDVLRGARDSITSDCKTTKIMLEGLVAAYEAGGGKREDSFDVDTLIRQLVGIIADLELRIFNLEEKIKGSDFSAWITSAGWGGVIMHC